MKEFLRLIALGAGSKGWRVLPFIIVGFTGSVIVSSISGESLIMMIVSALAGLMFVVSSLLTFYLDGVHKEKREIEERYHKRKLDRMSLESARAIISSMEESKAYGNV